MHTVKWFQVLRFNISISVYRVFQSNLISINCLHTAKWFQVILFNISHFFAHSEDSFKYGYLSTIEIQPPLPSKIGFARKNMISWLIGSGFSSQLSSPVQNQSRELQVTWPLSCQVKNCSTTIPKYYGLPLRPNRKPCWGVKNIQKWVIFF